MLGGLTQKTWGEPQWAGLARTLGHSEAFSMKHRVALVAHFCGPDEVHVWAGYSKRLRVWGESRGYRIDAFTCPDICENLPLPRYHGFCLWSCRGWPLLFPLFPPSSPSTLTLPSSWQLAPLLLRTAHCSVTPYIMANDLHWLPGSFMELSSIDAGFAPSKPRCIPILPCSKGPASCDVNCPVGRGTQWTSITVSGLW